MPALDCVGGWAGNPHLVTANILECRLGVYTGLSLGVDVIDARGIMSVRAGGWYPVMRDLHRYMIAIFKGRCH